MKNAAIVLVVLAALAACQEPPEPTEDNHMAPGTSLPAPGSKADVIARRLAACGTDRACLERILPVVEAHQQPVTITPTDPGCEGQLCPPGPGNGPSGTPNGKADKCFNDYLTCLEWCNDKVPAIPPFLVWHFQCVLGCSAVYAACRGAP